MPCHDCGYCLAQGCWHRNSDHLDTPAVTCLSPIHGGSKLNRYLVPYCSNTRHILCIKVETWIVLWTVIVSLTFSSLPYARKPRQRGDGAVKELQYASLILWWQGTPASASLLVGCDPCPAEACQNQQPKAVLCQPTALSWNEGPTEDSLISFTNWGNMYVQTSILFYGDALHRASSTTHPKVCPSQGQRPPRPVKPQVWDFTPNHEEL
jgi:hypothetical protein